MARPRKKNPSPEALRKRAQRARKAGASGPEKASKPASGRLAAVTVWVPPQDVKAIETHAQKLRYIARIPESEVPE